MIRRLALSILLVFPYLLGAQNVVDSMEYGDNTIQWRVYETDMPVTAFALTPALIWYCTDQAVGAYDLKTHQKRIYSSLGTVTSSGMKTIATDTKGGVWFGGSQGAIHYKNSQWKHYTEDNGLAHTTVNKIFVDSKSIWFATEKGISVFSDNAFKTYTSTDGVCGNSVRDITADNKGTLYFATDKGIAVFDGMQWSKFDVSNGLGWNNTKAIAYDLRKEELWVAAGEQDVNSYNGKVWNTYIDIQPGITSIMVDTQSRIWFGSTSGIIKYNGFEWIFEPAKVGFPAEQVNDMYRDGNGDLYFALENGILHMKNPYPF